MRNVAAQRRAEAQRDPVRGAARCGLAVVAAGPDLPGERGRARSDREAGKRRKWRDEHAYPSPPLSLLVPISISLSPSLPLSLSLSISLSLSPSLSLSLSI